MPQTAFRPNHMHIAWHDYTSHDTTLPISAAPLREKASVIGRTGLMRSHAAPVHGVSAVR